MVKNYKQDYFWNTLGVLAQNAISPILLVAVTRTNGVVDSGLFSYAMSVALVFWAFGIWGGRTYQVSDLRKEFTDHSYVLVRVLLGVAVTLISFIFCILSGYDMFKTLVIIAFVAFKVIESVSDAIYGVLQSGDRLYIAGRSLFLKAVIGSAVFIVIDIVTRNILWSAAGLLAVNLVVFAFYDLYYARRLGYSISKIVDRLAGYVRQAMIIIKRCSPIAAVIFLSMFSLNIPRYFLDVHYVEEVGYFGILVMPITVLALLITFLIQPKIIDLTKLFVNKRYDKLGKVIRTIVYMTVGVGLAGILATYFIGVPVLDFIFGLKFEPYKFALVLVVIGAIFNGIVAIYMNVFTIVRHFKALFYTLVITNLCLLVASMFVVKEYSVLGAVWLFTATNVVQSMILVHSYKKTMSRYKKGQLNPPTN